MSRGPEEWLRWQPLWDAYFVVVAVATAAGVTIDRDAAYPHRVIAVAVLVTLTTAHLGYGRRLIRHARGTRRALLYQVTVVVLFATAVISVPRSAFLVFALCAPAFMTAGPIAGAVIVLALHLVCLWATAPDTLLGAAGIIAASLSVVLGIWISQVIRQSTERGELIAELEATRAELARVSYEAGRAAEREQVADAVHDTIAQGLSSTIMLLQAALGALDDDPVRAHRHLELAAGTARDNLADARALITARPLPEATAGSLSDALVREVDRLRELTGIDATLHVEGDTGPAGRAVDVELLRLAQEALTNVRKHAAARRVTVLLAHDPGRIRLEVNDDGRGFAADTTPAGHGLPLMRRRLREAGGTLHIDSVPGAGTHIRIEVPT
ncbi:sensor histidine kinase [Actinoplanes sp. CA-252034]|uniref:sensor histidine kinase n=1 Tax=Actinoplanes sp. CA-252034 TaxID=3239906 RepID=UPI003D971E17